MISIDEAARAILERTARAPVERVPLERALGRFVALPLEAREDVPGFDNSAMDGYAVRAADVAAATEGSPVVLPVAGESRAGGAWPEPLPPGAAMRIFTGAPMPEGADAIVMQEDTEAGDGTASIGTASIGTASIGTASIPTVSIRQASAVGKHVRRRAEVLEAGQALLGPGDPIAPGEIGVLASQGYAFVPVHRRPRVAILSTGDELREIGEAARPGSLVDSNAHALAAAVREAGAEPELLPLGADDPAVLTERVRAALRRSDVLLSTGGVSVGDYDFVHRAFADAGVDDVFWKIRIKPGKPVRFGVAGSTLVLGLPGNPVSALVTFEVFVRPALRFMLGDPQPHRPLVEVELSRPMRAPSGRTELARARLIDRPGAVPLARFAEHQGSGALTSLLSVDALVVLAEGSGERAEGSIALALDVRAGRCAARSPWSA